MNTLRIAILALLSTFGAAQLAGCASDSSTGASGPERSTGRVVDDAAITAKVKTELATEAGIGDAMDINVTTNRGVVQLSGFVDSESTAKRAEELAKKVEGVQSVKNDLRVGKTSG